MLEFIVFTIVVFWLLVGLPAALWLIVQFIREVRRGRHDPA